MATPQLVPLVGHVGLRARLADAARRRTLPASILFHGPPGVGKQRLALWLAEYLLCQAPESRPSSDDPRPCGRCQGCRYLAQLTHPDLYWIFPRLKPKDAKQEPDAVLHDYGEIIAQRVSTALLYPPADGMEGIHIDVVKALVHYASRTPALGSRKVIVIGDAERMVVQEGTDIAANAFLKLLEEPLSDTTLLLTSSDPGALLPTIRSRVVNVRVPRLPDADVATWVGQDRVRTALDAAGIPGTDADRIKRARGAPGSLLAGQARATAAAAARRIYEAAQSPNDAPRFREALQQSMAGARGGFTDVLDELTEMLRDRAQGAVEHGDMGAANAAYRAVLAVADARTRAAGNLNPQLLTTGLMRAMRSRMGTDS